MRECSPPCDLDSSLRLSQFATIKDLYKKFDEHIFTDAQVFAFAASYEYQSAEGAEAKPKFRKAYERACQVTRKPCDHDVDCEITNALKDDEDLENWSTFAVGAARLFEAMRFCVKGTNSTTLQQLLENAIKLLEVLEQQLKSAKRRWQPWTSPLGPGRRFQPTPVTSHFV